MFVREGGLPSVRDDNVVKGRISAPETGEANFDDHDLQCVERAMRA
jgi:hypothetical protein